MAILGSSLFATIFGFAASAAPNLKVRGATHSGRFEWGAPALSRRSADREPVLARCTAPTASPAGYDGIPCARWVWHRGVTREGASAAHAAQHAGGLGRAGRPCVSFGLAAEAAHNTANRWPMQVPFNGRQRRRPVLCGQCRCPSI